MEKKWIHNLVSLLLSFTILLFCVTVGCLATEATAAARVGEVVYPTVSEAVANANGQMVKLLADSQETVTVNEDLYLDLNGYTLQGVTVTEGTLYGMDSATDDYDCSDGYGKILNITGNYAPHHKTNITGDIRRYIAVVDNGELSFHRFYVGLTHTTIRPSGRGVGYKAVFAGDSFVKGQLDTSEAYGYTLQLEGFDPVSVWKPATSFKSVNKVALLLYNYDAEQYGQTNLSATVQVKLADGTVISAAEYTTTLQKMVEAVNEKYTEYSKDKIAALAAWIEATPNMLKWQVENIVPLSEPAQNTVTFQDYDGTVLKIESVETGKDATAPVTSARIGYAFSGWDNAYTNITEDLTVTATYTQLYDPDAATGEIQYSEELVTATGWTTDGWTGDLENGFSHIVGQGSPLVFAMESTGTNLYRVEFDVESTYGAGAPNASVAFTVTLGNSERFITYKGGGSMHYSYAIRSVSDGDFKIIPCSIADPFVDDTVFSGTVKNISIRKVMGSATSNIVFCDKNSNSSMEIYADLAENQNVFIGKNVGLNNFSGIENTAVGNNALKENGSGYWNVSVGANSLMNNTIGSRNVALGYNALRENTVGDRNYAIGSFALQRNTSGRWNIAIGADALWTIPDGIGNIAIGGASLAELTSGDGNVSLGYISGQYSKGENTVSIGRYAMGSAKEGGASVAIGNMALYKNEGSNNVAMGNVSLVKNTTGWNNTAVGAYSLTSAETTYETVAIGHYAGGAIKTGGGSVFLGASAGRNATGNGNTCVGYFAGSNITGGYANVMIGRYVNASSANAGYELNIANTLYGDILNGRVGVKKQTGMTGYFNIGAGDGTTPQMVMDSGSLTNTAVPGAIEYDGTALYLTTADGKRYKLTMELVEEATVEAAADASAETTEETIAETAEG